MPDQPIRVNWPEVNSIQEVAGVYAWYFAPRFWEKDLSTIEQELFDTPSADTISTFLQRFLFQYFQEDPYSIQISGPLKPSFSGTIDHVGSVSETLVARLAGEPSRLRAINTALEMLAPHFCAPLYIGMSTNLRTRLTAHKRLIISMAERPVTDRSGDQTASRDSSFAEQVHKRGIPPDRLFVQIMPMPTAEPVVVDVENILNRISYPVLGRN